MMLKALIAVAMASIGQNGLPTVKVEADDTVIRKSCRVVIPKGTTILDTNGNGVIQIAASDIVVEFAEGSVLRGAAQDTRPDAYKGYGIRIKGRKNVTLRGTNVHGFWGGIWATDADGLTIEDVDASNNRRAHLKSTPVAEDGGDWLWPHNNDKNEWLTNYGAAIYIEDSDKVTVRRCRVRHGQNGLCLDRVNESKVYDNDLSFLSGWGIAMWRSSRNVISRNAVDFCVRGYSHGVYNRGQDSAGFLVFEQNNDNVFAENSATHGGDGFFGFAGREALGESPAPDPDFDYTRLGNNDNLLIGNDLSYAPAHGIEMTFSFGNRFIGNRLVGNAICGVWGGYSQDTLIAGNRFEANGEMGYGLERGGVNIEHGRGNRIVHNRFSKNKCGVHLWWDPDGDFVKKPWGLANGNASTDNLIAGNRFTEDRLVFHFRGKSDVTIGPNEISRPGKEIEAEKDSEVKRDKDAQVPKPDKPDYAVLGETRPVGARKHLRGRQNIIMTQWGPWDHESPLVRFVEARGRAHIYDLHKLPGKPKVKVVGKGVKGDLIPAAGEGQPFKYTVSARKPGVYPYTMKIKAGDYEHEVVGTILSAKWKATFFKWDVDPREDNEGWRKLARGPDAVSVKTDRLTFKYAFGGPSEQKLSETLTKAKIGGDHFGMIARTKLRLAKGKWKFTTMSDDGIRVTVDGKAVIDNWTWHGPKRDEGVFEQTQDKDVEIVVEHFEIDGYATLELDIAPVR